MRPDSTPFSESRNAPVWGIHQMMVLRRNHAMATEAATRRVRLAAYAAKEGISEAELARRIGRSPSQTSDMLAARKSFGEKIARSIEVKLGLPRLWLDSTDGAAPPASPAAAPELSPLESRLLDAFKVLLPEQRERLVGEVEATARTNASNFDAFAREHGLGDVIKDARVARFIDPAPPLPTPPGKPAARKRTK